MRKLLLTLWHDDGGFIIAVEYILIMTIVVIGIIVALGGIRDAIITELSELGNSYMALSQGYVLSGQSACCAMVDGSQAIDHPWCTPYPCAIPSCGYGCGTCDHCNGPCGYGFGAYSGYGFHQACGSIPHTDNCLPCN